jgi:nucleotide-binding universal stress UspA family protein
MRPFPRLEESIIVIVVGVDSSLESREALRWAIDEARVRRTNVLAVYAWIFPLLNASTLPPAELFDPGYFPQQAQQVVDAAVAELAGAAPGVAVETRAIEGQAAAVLVEASRDGELLVLGSRGHGGFSGLLLGSVGQQCAHHAHCPVVIVRRESHAAEPNTEAARP